MIIKIDPNATAAGNRSASDDFSDINYMSRGIKRLAVHIIRMRKGG
jgi:hypothetical protein